MVEMVGVDKGEQPWQIIDPSELLAPFTEGIFPVGHGKIYPTLWFVK
jgi:hypothetical protein